jgi:thiosulfate/3-mercaptopyruvate sulfurtransferase
VTTGWVRAHLGDPGFRLVDARPRSEYDDGHIPGAISLPVTDTFDPDGAKNYPLRGEKLQALLAARGIPTDRKVVAYDDGGETQGPRLFWTLEYAGHPDAAVLDGGFAAWKADGGAISTAATTAPPARFVAPPIEDRLADKQACLLKASAPSSLILDVRSPAEYRGDQVKAKAGGHIPGAVNLDWKSNFDGARLKDAASLRSMYAERGVTPDKQIIAHCQTGQRSSVTYWTLRLLGYPKVGNYAGSWAEWGNDPETPKVTGDQPPGLLPEGQGGLR